MVKKLFKTLNNSKTFSQFQALEALCEYYTVTKVFHISVAIQKTGSILFESTTKNHKYFQSGCQLVSF